MNQEMEKTPEIMDMKENNQPIAKVTTPPKKQRSQKQIEWSRELGRRSAEFKRQKKERETQASSRAYIDDKHEVQRSNNEAADRVESNKVAGEDENSKGLNIWYIIVPLALLIGGGLISWNKYRWSRDGRAEPTNVTSIPEKDKIMKPSIVKME